ncbi:hypothetical protein RJ639_008868 [Escallonia herrerae]|uniref:Reverse transcriptase Ty1/copia-type domain-containing protein n=1 Tax=Escallonia herrerae TaxID=1293975 RepID=A0AA89AVI0_9ASTE|nr:hypothetical protein RJ639_008868 [Escallonia herrerae]
MELEQLDVKIAFLHGDLEERIYMQQPEGFIEPGKKDYVCKLKRSLYGLKQSPRQWYKRFDTFMVTHGYSCCEYDCCVYYRVLDDGSLLLLTLYVDDMLIATKSKSHILHLKKLLSREFDMKDLGSAKKILGMEIHRDRKAGKLWEVHDWIYFYILWMANMLEISVIVYYSIVKYRGRVHGIDRGS